MRALRAWLREVDWPIVRRSTTRHREQNAFVLGVDAGASGRVEGFSK